MRLAVEDGGPAHDAVLHVMMIRVLFERLVVDVYSGLTSLSAQLQPLDSPLSRTKLAGPLRGYGLFSQAMLTAKLDRPKSPWNGKRGEVDESKSSHSTVDKISLKQRGERQDLFYRQKMLAMSMRKESIVGVQR